MNSKQLTAKERFTPAEVAARLGVGRGKVTGWIRSGALRAVNLAASPGAGKRDRFRISAADLAAFEETRAAQPVLVVSTNRRRSAAAKRTATEFIA